MDASERSRAYRHAERRRWLYRLGNALEYILPRLIALEVGTLLIILGMR
jgi:hypothetical protein